MPLKLLFDFLEQFKIGTFLIKLTLIEKNDSKSKIVFH